MRIIAGTLGGRRLAAPRGRQTRPTSDRVREALFAALGPLEGARVLDLYAGSGALGIEALSRGARRVVAVERAGAALAALRRNVATLGVGDRLTVLPLPVERAGERLEGPFDVILVDPPYDRVAALPRVLAPYLCEALLSPGATLVLEHATRDAPPPFPGLRHDRTRVYGDTSLSRYFLDET